MDEKTDIYHISIGSATTDAHFSVDFAADDSELIQKIDKLYDIWSRAALRATQLHNQIKGK